MRRELPPKPPDYDRLSWYDFSPMRPDEFAGMDAERWIEALTLKAALVQGVKQAQIEMRTRTALDEWDNEDMQA